MKFVNKSKYALYAGILLVLVMIVSAETLRLSQGYSSGRSNTDAELILEDDDVVVLQLLTPPNQPGVIQFGDTGDTSAGEVRYTHSTDTLSFRTAGISNRMVIDSNGNVGIGGIQPTILRTTSYTATDPATIPLLVQAKDDAFLTIYGSGMNKSAGVSFVGDEEPQEGFVSRNAVEKWRIYNDGATDSLYIGSQDNLGVIILDQTDIARFHFNDIRFGSRLTQGPADTSINNAYGFLLATGIGGGPAMRGKDQVGMFVDMHGTSEATSRVIGGQFRAGTQAASFTTDLAMSLRAMSPEKGSGSTITKAVGLRIDSIIAGEANYAIETLGTTPSVFGGNVGIGTTSPKSRLHIEGGDITLSADGSGIILKSTNGRCFKVTVNESGTLITTPESC